MALSVDGRLCAPGIESEVDKVTSGVTVGSVHPDDAADDTAVVGASPGGDLDQSLRAAQDGDESAFARLYCDLQPRLLRYATALVGQDADDVTAEAWLQITRDIRTFSGDLDAFRGWSARIVRNRAMDLLRSRRRRPVSPTGLDELLDRSDPHDAYALAAERLSTDNAIALIASLPRDQAEAVLLRVVFGLDPTRAGEVLGKRPGAIRVASHRGLKTLARRLGPTGDAATNDE